MVNEMRDATSTRPKMSLEDRAKIFMPFNPLAGFTQALRERERRALENVVDFHPLDDNEGEEGVDG